jgi:hypothetical protein
MLSWLEKDAIYKHFSQQWNSGTKLQLSAANQFHLLVMVGFGRFQRSRGWQRLGSGLSASNVDPGPSSQRHGSHPFERVRRTKRIVFTSTSGCGKKYEMQSCSGFVFNRAIRCFYRFSRSWPKPLRDCGQCRILFDSTRIPKKKRQLS